MRSTLWLATMINASKTFSLWRSSSISVNLLQMLDGNASIVTFFNFSPDLVPKSVLVDNCLQYITVFTALFYHPKKASHMCRHKTWKHMADEKHEDGHGHKTHTWTEEHKARANLKPHSHTTNQSARRISKCSSHGLFDFQIISGSHHSSLYSRIFFVKKETRFLLLCSPDILLTVL